VNTGLAFVRQYYPLTYPFSYPYAQIYRVVTLGYGPETIYIAGNANGSFTHSVNAPTKPFQGEAVARLYDKTGLRDALFLSDVYQPGDEALIWWKTWSIDTVHDGVTRINKVRSF
jgi:hypothetical protein